MASNVVKIGDYDVDALKFETPGLLKTRQDILLPSYKGQRCQIIQLPSQTLDAYGVPPKSEWCREDKLRAFLKLPVRDELLNFLRKIDERFGSNAMKEELFGDKSSKFTYVPIVRTSVDEEKPPYIKLQLMTCYETGEVRTSVTKKIVGGGLEHFYPKTVDDFAAKVRFKSRVACLVRPLKMWKQPTSNSEYKYGISFRVTQVRVEESERDEMDEQFVSFIED